MIYILLTVLANALIFVIFKKYNHYRVDTFQAIVFNYLVAFVIAVLATDSTLSIDTLTDTHWLWGALGLGLMFIGGFYLVGITAQRLGMSVVAISSKMSVAIPVVFGIIAYSESVDPIKISGIAMALLAVYLSSYTRTKLAHKVDILLPVILFVSSGLLDTTLKYMQVHYIPKDQISMFLSIAFLLAGVLGAIALLMNKKTKWRLKNLYGGVLLGVVNYFSMYFLLKALQSPGLESATVFTINNVSIVMLSALIGTLIFKEKLLPINLIGLALSVVSIAIITLGTI